MCNTLSAWTTFGIGGKAAKIVCAYSREALVELSVSGLVIGMGSNILVGDGGYNGLVIVNRYESIARRGFTVTAGSGTRLNTLCAYLTEQGLSGLEWAAGIPGSVGGAVKMNAGAFGGDISKRLLYADVMTPYGVERRTRDELGFSYRNSNIRSDETVLSATFLLDNGDPAVMRSVMDGYKARRRATQPSGRTAGSVFKNPRGVSVGRVLEEAGLKGLRRGGAVISLEHANIIVNVGGATARNVVELIAEMKDALLERGISAREEIVYIGDFL